MGDSWPMIAGVGAGVAAAAAVGQMIVAAVSLGNQDANVSIPTHPMNNPQFTQTRV